MKHDKLFDMEFKIVEWIFKSIHHYQSLCLKYQYTLEFFNQLFINMSKACTLLFTVDKNVVEKTANLPYM